MIIRLQHQRSDGEKDTYHLKSGRRYHLGRGSACEVRILDLKLSRKHCAIEYLEGEWRVIDLASTNGCKVDGDQIVGSVPLKVGSQIEIGQSTIAVTRILGDDELDEEDEDTLGTVAPAAESVAPVTPIPTPAPRPAAVPTPVPAPKPAAAAPPAPKPQLSQLKTPAPRYEPEPMDDEPEPLPKPKPAVEDSESDWDPLPEQDAMTKVGALTPLPMKAQAQPPGSRPTPAPPPPPTPAALEAARRAAASVAQQAQGSTGAIQKPGSLGRDTPRPQLRTPELDSGGYKSLDLPETEDPSPVLPKEPTPPRPVRIMTPAATPAAPPAAAPAAESPPAPAEGPAQKPGTETRRRQQIQPVLVQRMDADDIATALPAALPLPVPESRPPPPPAAPSTPGAVAASSPPAASAGPDAAAAAKPEAERTFFISVLGRRVGPLTRAAARDLKARELKGTLTVKDLDQYA